MAMFFISFVSFLFRSEIISIISALQSTPTYFARIFIRMYFERL